MSKFDVYRLLEQGYAGYVDSGLIQDAADEIERLANENSQLTAALACRCDECREHCHESQPD